MVLQPGSLATLVDRPGRTFQVVNLDAFSDCVWVRGWPLSPRRHPTFAVSEAQVRRRLAPAACVPSLIQPWRRHR